MSDIHNLNGINQTFDSLGEPINRFKLSLSNIPFLNGDQADEKLFMLIENKIFDYNFSDSTFNYIEDDVQGTLNLIPMVGNTLSNFNENNLELIMMLDEFRFNYMMFYQWRTALIRKFRNIEETEYVEANQEYFIDELTLDILDNQGNPELIYSITFQNLALISLSGFEINTHNTTNTFRVGLRYENVIFNIDKMDILKAFREINN